MTFDFDPPSWLRDYIEEPSSMTVAEGLSTGLLNGTVVYWMRLGRESDIDLTCRYAYHMRDGSGVLREVQTRRDHVYIPDQWYFDPAFGETIDVSAFFFPWPTSAHERLAALNSIR
jgi:hypothetical protein